MDQMSRATGQQCTIGCGFLGEDRRGGVDDTMGLHRARCGGATTTRQSRVGCRGTKRLQRSVPTSRKPNGWSCGPSPGAVLHCPRSPPRIPWRI